MRIPLGPDLLLLKVEELRGDKSASSTLESTGSAQELLDVLPHLAWRKDTSGVYRAANTAFADCCGRSVGEIVGCKDSELWSARVAARFEELDREALSKREVVRCEELFADRDGVRWLELSTKPLMNADSECVGTVGWGCDISERTQLQERQRGLESRLEQTQRLESVGLLAGGLAHDINNLLLGVLGHAELALRGLKHETKSPAILERLSDLRSVTLQASTLTNQMLTYSGRAEAVAIPVNLAEIVQQTRSLIESTFGCNVCLEISADDHLPAVDADASELRQIVINLLTNAAEAVQTQAGRVVVRLEKVSAEKSSLQGRLPAGIVSAVRLEVVDSGEGMPKEVAAKIFEPFFSTKPSGRGLGLAAVRTIVDRLGGDIQVSSVPAQGTTVSVELPSSAHSPSAPAPDDVPTQIWQASGELLLVDDQPAVRAVVSLLLRDHGFVVREAGTAKCALETYRRNLGSVRAVLLDLSLPDSCGERVFTELRRIRPDLPIIVWSGFEERDVRQRFGGDVPFEFVQKPFRMDTLVQRLRLVLDE